jgi:4-hydroxybenzoate polyprenyltransferase
MATHTEGAALEPRIEPPPVRRPRRSAVARSLRPKQWTKNLIVFVGAFFALRLTDSGAMFAALAAFAAFCLLSSAGYLVNDVLDAEADRQHPIKRQRAIASGAISARFALGLAAALVGVALLLAATIGPAFIAVAAAYIGLSVLYSALLKHLVLIDLFAIAAGFVLRVVAGAVAVGVRVSPWLYVCTILVALFLGLAKRRQELTTLQGAAGGHRRNLSEYSIDLVDQLTNIVTSATIMAYSLYTFSAPNVPRNDVMMITIPLVLYGVFRYLYLVRVKGLGGSPEDLLLADRPLLGTAAAWAALCGAVLYLLR